MTYLARIQRLLDERDAIEAQIQVLGREWVSHESPYQEGQKRTIPADVASPDQGCLIEIQTVSAVYQREERRWYWAVGGKVLSDGRKSQGGFRVPAAGGRAAGLLL